MRRLAVAIAVLALGAIAPAAEAAVTPQEARAIAERAIAAGPDGGPFESSGPLMPAQRRRFRPVVEIHALRRVLKRGTLVGQGLERRRRMFRVKAPALLAWGNYAPGAAFAHPSRLVVVDRASGRIAHNRVIGWWPEVNDKRVFKRGRGRLRTPNNSPGQRRPRAAVVPGFRNDCVVTIGDRTDPYFLKGMAAMSAMAQRHGMPVAAARRVNQLGLTIDRLARANPACVDVIIYVAGHGVPPLNTDIPGAVGSEKPTVVVKAPAGGGQPAVEESFNLDDLKAIIRARRHLSFKLVIDSCFSGRWTTAMAEPNLRVTVTSSAASEVTFLAVTHAARGRQVKGQIEWSGGAVGDPDKPGDPPPFTAGVIKAIDDFAADPANANTDAGKAIGYAGTHREGDRARALGWQHGRTDDRTSERGAGPGCPGQPQQPRCQQQPPGQVAYEVGVTGSWRHIAPGSSEVCWDIRTVPPRPNAEVNVQTSSPGVVSGGNQSVRTDSSGFVRVRVRINSYGPYSSSVSVVAQDGAARTGNGEVTVTDSAGTCPPP
jgi:hypothetical protein